MHLKIKIWLGLAMLTCVVVDVMPAAAGSDEELPLIGYRRDYDLERPSSSQNSAAPSSRLNNSSVVSLQEQAEDKKLEESFDVFLQTLKSHPGHEKLIQLITVAPGFQKFIQESSLFKKYHLKLTESQEDPDNDFLRSYTIALFGHLKDQIPEMWEKLKKVYNEFFNHFLKHLQNDFINHKKDHKTLINFISSNPEFINFLITQYPDGFTTYIQQEKIG